MGCLMGVLAARDHGCDEVTILGDSKLVVMQLEGLWDVRSMQLLPYHTALIKLLRESFGAKWVAQHVPRERNREADRLLNDELDRLARSS